MSQLDLPFTTAGELSASVPEEVSWLVRGIAAPGLVSQISGKVKVGKSTFIASMISAVIRGVPFLGMPTQTSPVVWLTEENPVTVRQLLLTAGLSDADDLHLLSLYDHEVLSYPWRFLMESATDLALVEGAKMIVVDTLLAWARLEADSENDAASAAKVATPLRLSASENIAVVVVRHERKSGGHIADSARGSSAISGSMDLMLRLSEASNTQRPNRRVVQGVGRLPDVPEHLVYELAGDHLSLVGNSYSVEADRIQEELLRVLDGSSIPLTEKELLERLPDSPARSTLKRVLTKLANSGLLLVHEGGGQRGLSKTYSRRDLTLREHVSTPPNT